MTREEALREVNLAYVGTVREHFHWKLINQIYDDFEKSLSAIKVTSKDDILSDEEVILILHHKQKEPHG